MTKALDADYFTGCSVFSGLVRYKDLCYLLITNDELVRDEVQYMRIYTIDKGELGGFTFDWAAISSAMCEVPSERFIAISPFGKVQVIGGGENKEEASIADGNDSPEKRGALREVRGIAGKRAYAVGTNRQIYRRDAPNRWTCVDKPLRNKAPTSEQSCLESIDGFSEKDLYTVGWEGEIWQFDGRSWSLHDSGTNLSLFKVKCTEGGVVYAAGQAGMLLRGEKGRWQQIEHEQTEDNFRALEWFESRLYAATMTELFLLEDDELISVKYGVKAPRTCGVLSARDGLMWSIGEKDVMEFDGKKWKRVLAIA